MLASGKNKKRLSAICERTGGRTKVHPESEFNRKAEPALPCDARTIQPGEQQEIRLIGAAAVAAAAFATPALAQAVISDWLRSESEAQRWERSCCD
jgi:hypothetical protein